MSDTLNMQTFATQLFQGNPTLCWMCKSAPADVRADGSFAGTCQNCESDCCDERDGFVEENE